MMPMLVAQARRALEAEFERWEEEGASLPAWRAPALLAYAALLSLTALAGHVQGRTLNLSLYCVWSIAIIRPLAL